MCIFVSGGGGKSAMCSDAMKRLACVEAFPECPLASTSISGISYFLPCKLMCQQVNALCGDSLDCSPFPANDCSSKTSTC